MCPIVRNFFLFIVQNYRTIYQKIPAQLLTHTSPTWSHLLQLIMQHNNNFQEKYLHSFTSSSIMRYANLQLLMYNISNIANSEK
jgi:hypothetical protein